MWIDWTNACELGYNQRKLAHNNSGIKRSQEAKDRQRVAMIGFRHSEVSIEKMRIVQSNKSELTRLRIGLSKTGHTVSKETRAKIGFRNRIIQKVKKEAELMFILDKELRNTFYV